MTIDEVYAKYKHLDPVLSEPGFAYGLAGRVLLDLWKAIKDEQQKKGEQNEKA